MAKNEQVRVHSEVLRADEEAFLALAAIRDYQPANAAFAHEALRVGRATYKAAQEAELHAQHTLAAARDAAVAAQWDFHNLMLGAKSQVLAQYGPDSDQLASLGMKKKSDRRRPSRTEKTPS